MSASSRDSIDCHIHLQSMTEANTLLRAMDQSGIQMAVLMGSPRFTITLRAEDGFTQYHENNLELLKIRKAHPDRFVVWPTLDPLAADNVERLKGYLAAGASGLKLYVGHGFSFGTPPRYLFHTTPIDGAALIEVYRYCETNSVPICLHINTTNKVPEFKQEFERVLTLFPRLRVLAPHWMLAARRPTYLRDMLQRFPNLFTDTSFGQDDFVVAGFKNIAANALKLKQLLMDFPERVLFGSDLVCTDVGFKTRDWMSARMDAYQKMLASERYRCPISGEERTGLGLPAEVLAGVLRGNALKLIYSSEKR